MKNFGEKLLKWNFKKIAVAFVAVAAAVGITAGALLYNNFGSRVEGWRNQAIEYRQSVYEQYQTNPGTEEALRYNGYAQGSRCGGRTRHRGRGYNSYYSGVRGHRGRMGHMGNLAQQLGLSTGDRVLLVTAAGAAMLLRLAARILLALWIAQKAMKSGTSPVFWGIFTAIFHICAVIIFFIYRSVKHKCPACKKIQNNHAEFCTNCGTAMMKTCEGCGNKNNKDDGYCSHCGAHLN